MKRCKAIVLAILPFVAAAMPGWATAQQPTDFRPGFYLGGAIGQGEVKDTCPACDESDTTWKVFGGYQFSRGLGVEAAYHDFGTFGSAAIGGVTPAGSADARAVEIVAVGTIPVHQRVDLFAKGGAYRYDVENSATGISNEANEWTFGAGVKYHFTRTIAGRLEWQRYLDMGAMNANTETDVDVVSLGVQVQW